ncbi:MAG: aspartyl/glutamyl-tRNA amidotransferase subunit C [Alphaproteobacteria bacterium]|nr:MAG: aspartyl/glutamyl-tRNA amidotransferase subunit C [Alphaproteobacteria bacterium]
MKFTKDELLRLERLARIKIKDEEKAQKQLGDIFSWIEKLNEAYKDADDASIIIDSEHKHLERKEQAPLQDQHELILSNAPKRAHRFFVVPKVKD